MRPALILSMLLALAPAPLAATPTTPQTPAPLGRQPLDGQNARPGQTFTLGQKSPLNFTLRSAAYSLERVVIGHAVLIPRAGEKLLVLHYTVANPQKTQLRYYWADLRFTALDAQDRPHDFEQAVARDGTSEPLEAQLKPAEQVQVMTVIRVPAQGVVPKLIVQRDGDAGAGVLRYDLHGQVAGLSAPYADPADPSGASALPQPRLSAGTPAQFSSFDLRLEEAHFTEEALNGKTPSAKHRYLVATFTLKNPLASDARYSWSSLTPSLRDTDGELSAYNQTLLKGSRDEVASGTLPTGQEVRVRYFFELPDGVLADSIAVRDDTGRTLAFDVTGAH